MSETLAGTLNENGADRDAIQQGLRLFLSERFDDLTPNEMLEEMERAAGANETGDILRRVQADPDLMNEAALLALDAAWSSDENRPAVEAAIKHAKNRLPVVEIGIVAIVVMYAMHRLLPAQPAKVTRRTTFTDGLGFVDEEVIEYESFQPVVSGFKGLLGGAVPPPA